MSDNGVETRQPDDRPKIGDAQRDEGDDKNVQVADPDADDGGSHTGTVGRGRNRRASDIGARQLSVSIRSLSTVLLVVALVAALAVFVYRDLSGSAELDELRTAAADQEKAEDVAGRYAVAAATLDFKDLTPWIAAMKEGVSPDLQKKYDVIGQAMEQIITPLRMQTTAELVVADTQESNGDLFRVDAVVNVNTKSVQTPDGGNTVAVYTIALDRSKDWMITEVGDPTGGIAGNLGPADGGANPTDSPPPPPTPGG